jgi:hypothetical protein
MNSQYFNHLLAVFFANEFLVSILPTSSKSKSKKKDDVLKEYRENIDNYCNSTTGFIRQKNPAYEIVIDKITSFFKSYIPSTRESIINFACSELCSKVTLSKINAQEKQGIFRKFIIENIKAFTAQALVNSTSYIDFIIGTKIDPQEAKLSQKKMVNAFEVIISDNKNQIFAEFSCYENGKDPSTISIISNESRMIEELRKQNEELRFEFLRVQEENYRLKQELHKATILGRESDRENRSDQKRESDQKGESDQEESDSQNDESES